MLVQPELSVWGTGSNPRAPKIQVTQHNSKDPHMVSTGTVGGSQELFPTGQGPEWAWGESDFSPSPGHPWEQGSMFFYGFIKHFITPPPSFPLAWACPVPRGYSSLFLTLREREVATPSPGHQAPRLGEGS